MEIQKISNELLIVCHPVCFYHPVFLSADSHSSALLVRPSKEEEEEEGRRRKEGGLFSNSLDNMEDLKVWGC